MAGDAKTPPELWELARNPEAPSDERWDAQRLLEETYSTTSSDLYPVSPTDMTMLRSFAETSGFNRPPGSSVVPYQFGKAATADPGFGGRRIQGYQVPTDKLGIYGPVQGVDQFYLKPGPLGFEALRLIADKVGLIHAIIQTRSNMATLFAEYNMRDRTKSGHEIAHRDSRRRLTEDELEDANLLSRFIRNSGWISGWERQEKGRDTLHSLIRKMVRDTYTIDAVPINLEWTRAGEDLVGYYPLDGTTIYLTGPEGYQNFTKARAVQVVNMRVVEGEDGQPVTFTWKDLIYQPRNPRTDLLWAVGYGFSEVEMMVRLITGWLNAITYNAKGFESNSVPKGFLTVFGNYNRRQLDSFIREWNNLVTGVSNAWRLPVLISNDPKEAAAKFERMDTGWNEMHFRNWIIFLNSIVTACFGMDPTEINSDAFTAKASTLSGSDTEERLASSRDKGLKPLLQWIQFTINDRILSELTDRYIFRFTGLSEEDANREWEKKKLSLTLNELRAEQDLPPVDDPRIGDAPVANPNLMGVYTMTLQPEQPGMEGMNAPGAEGAPLEGEEVDPNDPRYADMDFGELPAGEEGGEVAPPGGGPEAGGGGEATEKAVFVV